MAHINRILIFCIFNSFILNGFSQIISIKDSSQLIVENFIGEKCGNMIDVSITYQKPRPRYNWEYLFRRLMILNGFSASVEYRYNDSGMPYYLLEIQNDTLHLDFRATIESGHGYLREISQVQSLLDSGCAIIHIGINKDSALVWEYDNVAGIDVYMAIHHRKNKYKILSQLGQTNSCGLIHCKIPYDERIVVAFQKPKSKYFQVIKFKHINTQNT